MKALILALLVAAGTAVPIPEDNSPVEVIAHKIPEQQSHYVGVERKQKEGETEAPDLSSLLEVSFLLFCSAVSSPYPPTAGSP